MGTNYRHGSINLPGARAHKKVIQHIAQAIKSETAEYGTNPYSGHLGTKASKGIEFVDRSFRTSEKAREYMEDHAYKHGPILVARITNKGHPYWFYTAACSD